MSHPYLVLSPTTCIFSSPTRPYRLEYRFRPTEVGRNLYIDVYTVSGEAGFTVGLNTLGYIYIYVYIYTENKHQQDMMIETSKLSGCNGLKLCIKSKLNYKSSSEINRPEHIQQGSV